MSQEIDPFTIEINSQDLAAIDRQLENDRIEEDSWDTIPITDEDFRNIDEQVNGMLKWLYL